MENEEAIFNHFKEKLGGSVHEDGAEDKFYYIKSCSAIIPSMASSPPRIIVTIDDNNFHVRKFDAEAMKISDDLMVLLSDPNSIETSIEYIRSLL